VTIWIPELQQRRGPRYLAIAEALQADIAAGRLAPGSRLPTHRALAYRLGVTVGTVSRAYLEAERRGLIDGQVGRGTFVRARGLSTAFAIPLETGGAIDLSLNRPVVEPAVPELAATLAQLSRRNDLAPFLAYQSELGLPSHREAGAAWLARLGVEATPERIVITCGAQHGLFAALGATCRAGDTVLVEALTYPAVKMMASQLSLQLQAIAMDEAGLLPEALEAAARKGRGRVLFTMPTLHNPTTATLSEARRHAVIEIARRFDLLLIEDDIYGFLLATPQQPLVNLAPERSFHVTSISKSMAAGLRLGYVVAPAEMVGRVGAVVRSSSWMAPPLTCEIASQWINDQTSDRLVRARREQARTRQEIAARKLAGHRIDTHPESFHLWLHLPEPWRWSDFVAAAQSRGVLVTPPDLFVTGRATAPHAVRLCLSAEPSDARLEAGLTTLSELLSSPPELRLNVV